MYLYSMGQFTCKYCGAQNNPPPQKKKMYTYSNNTISFNKSILDPYMKPM